METKIMIIVKTTKTLIYCYHDYSFMIFNRDSIISNAEIIGHCWAGGRANAGNGNSPINVPVEAIKRDTVYHSIFITALMELI